MIHRTMSLLLFFSSAIKRSTAHPNSQFKSHVESPETKPNSQLRTPSDLPCVSSVTPVVQFFRRSIPANSEWAFSVGATVITITYGFVPARLYPVNFTTSRIFTETA